MKRILTAAAVCGSMLLSCMMQAIPAGAVFLSPDEDITVTVSDSIDDTLPEQYDMRQMGLTTYVQRQGGNGMCWSFAALGSLESTMVARQPDVDLSEWALTYYAYSPEFGLPLPEDTDAFHMGGNYYVAASTLSRWCAPAAEKAYPFGDKTVLDPALSLETLCSQAVCHVTDVDMYLYNENARLTASLRRKVKQSVYSGQAVALSYYNVGGAYNSVTYAYYNAENRRMGGNYHAVTIVGWDDAYPASNFSKEPSQDGAFLCKNSWGADWGDGGYFWISYADPSIVELYTVRGEDKEKHTGMYQHDDYGFWGGLSVEDKGDTSVYVANVFTAEEDTCITAVMFATAMTNESYAVRVYNHVRSNCDPTLGVSTSRTRGSFQYPGYHTVTLDEPIFVSAGERFSVSVHLSGRSGQHIACEAYTCYTTEHADGTVEKNEGLLSEERMLADFHPDESYYSLDGLNWVDMYYDEIPDSDIQDTETGETIHVSGKAGNICIRALTQEIGRVVFSDYAEALPYNSEITLSCPGAEEIWYSTDGQVYALYTEPLVLRDEMQITAYAVMDGKEYPAETHHYAVQTAQLSSILRSDDKTYLEFRQLSENCWTAECKDHDEALSLFPISTAGILTDNGYISSGEWLEVREGIALTLHTCAVNMLDGTYVIYLTDILPGDVNLDGLVNASDAADVLIYAAEHGAGVPGAQDAAWLERGDCDGSGTDDAADAAWILQYAAEHGADSGSAE